MPVVQEVVVRRAGRIVCDPTRDADGNPRDELGVWQMVRCPGQDLRFWKLGDIFDVACPHCGMGIEFWKDEPSVKCPQCRRVILTKCDVDTEQTERICQLIADHAGGRLEDSLESKILRDAERLATVDDHATIASREQNA